MTVPLQRVILTLVLLAMGVSSAYGDIGEKTISPGEGKPHRPSTEPIPGVDRKLDIVYTQYGQRKMHLDLFTPKKGLSKADGPLPTIVVVHGGGWLKGNKTKFHALAQTLASRGYITAVIEYRLGGEALFPAGIQDCNTAVRFLRANAAKYNIDPKRIGAVGGSAGGHLVGLMAAGASIKEFQGDGYADASSHLSAAIVLAGPLDLASGSVVERSRKQPDKSNANRWFGKTFDQAPDLYRKASPLSHISKQTPPILFMAGEYDKPHRNAATRKKLDALGIETGIVIVERGKHGCWNLEPWFTPMVDEMEAFFRKTLK